ncbi:hypothetical protein ACH4E7_41785 [Kitasatospora sp. NPDC018058]|uniref:hypothetical protein n=1 Tax=Kitasatospora sp. NPDC018058 TaxID=3364025 RepID=UPI0037BFE8BA
MTDITNSSSVRAVWAVVIRGSCEYVGMARRSGRIPWDAIRDDTRIAVDAPPSFAGPAARVLTGERG